MKKELSIKQIYNDFLNKIILSDIERDVLNMYIKNESILKISDELCISTSTTSRIISQIKEKYDNYKKLEMAKLDLLSNKN